MLGHWIAGAVKRLFGCAHGSLACSGVRSEMSRPFQSSQPVTSAGGSGVRPSHQTSWVVGL